MRMMDVVAYDEAWPIMFDAEKAILMQIMGEIATDIQHFGSTAVPGLAAKPIIDILVLVENIEYVDNLNAAMCAGGYEAFGEFGIKGRRYFVRPKDDNSGNHSHHVHIYGHNDAPAKELAFRDFLRTNAAARAQYAALKIKLSQEFYADPSGYTVGKTACIEEILSRLASIDT